MSCLVYFVFVSFALGDDSKKILPYFLLKNVLPVFSSMSFIVLLLICRSIFIDVVRDCSNIIDLAV